jgi:hypothetical protein
MLVAAHCFLAAALVLAGQCRLIFSINSGKLLVGVTESRLFSYATRVKQNLIDLAERVAERLGVKACAGQLPIKIASPFLKTAVGMSRMPERAKSIFSYNYFRSSQTMTPAERYRT